MRFIDFTKIGGYRLKQATLRYMQESYFYILKVFIGFLNLPATGNFIIYGCNVSGSNITDGMMYIDGELCPFTEATGTAATKIKKTITVSGLIFKNLTTENVFRQTTATIDSSGVALSNFTRIALPVISPGTVIDPAVGSNPAVPTIWERIQKLESICSVFQVGGGMVLWNKPASEIPEGWQEVVNWRERIPVGMNPAAVAGNYTDPDFSPLNDGSPGREGGSRTVTLNLTNLPEFTVTTNLPANSGSVPGGGGIAFPGAITNTVAVESEPIGGNGTNGQAVPVNILNPYRTVIFIERAG